MSAPYQVRARRVVLLMRNDVVTQAKSIGLVAATVSGFMLLALVANILSGETKNFYPFVFSVTVVVGGLILTSLSFAEMHDPLKATRYLTIPGSQSEKYLSKWLLTSIGFSGATIVYFSLFSLLAGLITRLFFQLPMPVFNVSDTGNVGALSGFLAVQPLFFFGSIYFKRMALIKTALSIFTCMIVLGIFVPVVGGTLFAGVDWGVASQSFPFLAQQVFTRFAPALEVAATVVFKVMLPLVFLALGYLRLTEYELNNGV